MSKGPLQGIKVVDLSNYVAVPSCARMLAEFGAEVIKIENFNGDPWRNTGMSITHSSYDENPVYEVYNIGKKDICINIKHEKGMECLMKIIADADIFLTNTRPKSLKKLGLDPETLTAKFPRLIYAFLNGYGPKGPEADSPGFDNVAFWARSGFLADMSPKENSYPVNGPTGIGDSVSGSALLSGILAALYQREKTGKGDIIETSLYGSAIWFMASMITGAQDKYHWAFPKTRFDHSPLSRVYQCADGRWLFIVILEYKRYARKVFEILGLEDEFVRLNLEEYATLREHTPELVPIMESAFKSKPIDEWLKLFHEADLTVEELSHFRDIPNSEQAWANDYVEEYHMRNGETCVLPCPPVHMASYEREPSHFAPMPGEQTDEVLRQYGYSEEEIAELHACKAVQ